jgi:tetratricopeptide (TPR) repeat protein
MSRRARKNRLANHGSGRRQEKASRPDRTPAGPEPRSRKRYLVLAVCGFLILAIAVVFGQTVQHEFVNYDDPQYVYDNPMVARGVTAAGIPWAFQSHASNWHPLTWLSHMLDCQLYGLKHPGGHHLTNVLLHAITAILLFLVLRKMTGDLWPSAFVAALFAIHPLHVESVAWVAERKDVLSGLFFVLTLGAYVGYVRHWFSLLRYLLMLGLFALGLLCKPTLVTLPFVLLLLDYWPLGRFSPPAAENGAAGERRRHLLTALRLVVEKMPLFLLAAVSCVVTYAAQERARVTMEALPLGARIANALVSYVTYLAQFFCPTGLAVFYPYPADALPIWKIAGACLVLVGVSAAVLVCRRRYPYLFVGWLWYLGMLVPMIGLVQVGTHAMADRYAYLTQIGLYLAFAWGAMHVAEISRYRYWAYAVAPLLIVVLAACACQQVSYWRDSETLWTHAIDCTSRNWMAHDNLGLALVERGQAAEAIAQYEKALEIKPDLAKAHNNLANALLDQGQVDAAVPHYEKALEIKPDFAEAHSNFGNALVCRGQVDAAIVQYEKALEIDGDFAPAHYSLGNVLLFRGQLAAAIAHYEKALEIKPDFAMGHDNLGLALARQGRAAAAIAQFEKALKIKHDDAEAHNYLGLALAGRGEVDAAVAHFQKALAIKPDFAEARRNLDAVLAGRRVDKSNFGD